MVKRATERLDASVPRDRARAAELLGAGGLVALPTETVYGLGARADDARAASGIFVAKARPAFDPLIVHVASPDAVSAWAETDHPAFALLAEAFWPGPLTLVVPKRASVPDVVTSGLQTVAVRVPASEATRDVLTRCGAPIAAPSANLFGRVSPTSAAHVLDQLEGRIDAVLDAGACAVGVESTIVALGEGIRVLRVGGTTVEALERVVGPVELALQTADGPEGTGAPEAPGQLSRHYAPSAARLRIVDAPRPRADAGLLVASGEAPAGSAGYGQVWALSPTGDLSAAASALFATLRRLDRASVSEVDVLLCAEHGLGRAINDRLRRAAVAPSGERAG